MWRTYRRQFLGQPWSEVKKALRANKYVLFPKRLHSKAQWWLVKYWMKRYCELLSGPFRVGDAPGMGLGVYASRQAKKGSTLLFGQLHRVTHKATLRLDAVGETSLMQFQHGTRIQWCYMGGPASLVNHACRSFNAEFLFGTRRGEQGEFLVQLTKDVEADEQILVHYGDEFWTQSSKQCQCRDCERDRKHGGDKRRENPKCRKKN